MKLESLLNQFDQLAVEFDGKDLDELTSQARMLRIIMLLVAYIGNPKIEEKINEIVF